jgi:hypothetical protein
VLWAFRVLLILHYSVSGSSGSNNEEVIFIFKQVTVKCLI